MKKVLLLNPPADPPVSRDYYCGHFTKGCYYWPQLDLLAMSGSLSGECEVAVLDAVVESLSAEATMARVVELAPDAVVAMTAAVSWSSDMAFLSKLKDKCNGPVLVTGDYPRAEPRAVLAQNECIDAVVLDFADSDVCAFVGGDGQPGLRNVYSREDSGEPEYKGGGCFAYPVPRHELFNLKRYYMPQSLHHPAATLLTDFGCPFACDFCFMERVMHRLRDIGNVAEELKRLHEMGIRELFLADQSFGSKKSHAREVCRAISEAGGGSFTWTASMRVDAMDEALLKEMRASGCHTLMLGVETPAQEVLDQHEKRTTREGIVSAFARARKVGFRTLAHFVLGLTGETEELLKRLVDFAIELDPDIASFNIAAPAWNTTFGDHVRNESWLLGEGVEIASADGVPVWEHPEIPLSSVVALRDAAVRRFYMRPGYVIKQLLRVRSIYQLKVLFREGFGILKSRSTGRPK